MSEHSCRECPDDLDEEFTPAYRPRSTVRVVMVPKDRYTVLLEAEQALASERAARVAAERERDALAVEVAELRAALEPFAHMTLTTTGVMGGPPPGPETRWTGAIRAEWIARALNVLAQPSPGRGAALLEAGHAMDDLLVSLIGEVDAEIEGEIVKVHDAWRALAGRGAGEV